MRHALQDLTDPWRPQVSLNKLWNSDISVQRDLDQARVDNARFDFFGEN